MNRRLAGGLLGAVVLVVLAVIYFGRSGSGDAPGASSIEQVEVTTGGDTDLRDAVLYFPDREGTLSTEARPLNPWSSPESGARVLVEAVLAGPSEPAFASPLPPGTELGVTYLAPSALLYVDLVSSEHTRPPVTGSLEELLSVFSLVNTVLLNTPEIEAVVLLWNGQQHQTFAGHVDTSLPLRPDRDLIKSGQ